MANIKILYASDEASNVGIASNSLSVTNGDLLALVNGFITKAVAAAGRIVGIANGTKVYSATNQTVELAKVNYLRTVSGETIVKLNTATSTLTQAMVGKFFDINGAQQVDVTTNASAKGTLPLQLIKFVSSGEGEFLFV